MIYLTERYTQLAHELEPLIADHFDEVEMDTEAVPLCVDHELYRSLDYADRLHMTTARENGKLVGYLAAMVSGVPHSADTLHAVVDAVYLKRDFRKGLAGVKLYRHFEQEMAQRGVRKIYAGCKATFDLTPLFRRMGYRHAETYFSKVL